MREPLHRVLIVDDDSEFADSLGNLMPARFVTQTAYSLKQAVVLITQNPFDSVVSDFVLAEHNGFDFLETIQSLNSPPKVFFMTAFANKDMAISLLNQGVQGLLEKPFSISELTSLLEKHEAPDHSKFWRIEPSLRVVNIGSQKVELTEVEYQLVTYFLANLGKWVRRQELIETIWGQESRSRNALDTHLTNLKRKIPALKGSLKTVRGRGYLLESKLWP